MMRASQCHKGLSFALLLWFKEQPKNAIIKLLAQFGSFFLQKKMQTLSLTQRHFRFILALLFCMLYTSTKTPIACRRTQKRFLPSLQNATKLEMIIC